MNPALPVYEMTVPAGQDIKAEIEKHVMAMGWESVWIPSAIGSVICMEFTTPVQNTLPLKTGRIPCPDAAELTSFTGEVMKKEKMDPALADIYPDNGSPLFIHIHASCAAAGGRVTGGGLRAGKAFRAVRVFMIPLEINA